MSGTQCRCLNPESGGIKCPDRFIAICIRGKDRECYGECVQIPSSYHKASPNFKGWANKLINQRVIDYILKYPLYDFEVNLRSLHKISEKPLQNGGTVEFQYSNLIKIYVQFRYKFANYDSYI